MADNGKDKLTPNQKKALEALLRSTTTAGAALAAGLSARTLYRHLADRNSAIELSRRQDQTIKATTSALAAII